MCKILLSELKKEVSAEKQREPKCFIEKSLVGPNHLSS